MLRNAIFSTCHGICLRKVDLEYENGKQLQVTIIKVTESKENRSIHRLDMSGSIGPPCLPPPPDSYGSDIFASLGKYKSRSELFGFHSCNEVITGLHLPYMSKTGRTTFVKSRGSKRVYVFNRENILTQGPHVSWKERKSGRIILL